MMSLIDILCFTASFDENLMEFQHQVNELIQDFRKILKSD